MDETEVGTVRRLYGRPRRPDAAPDPRAPELPPTGPALRPAALVAVDRSTRATAYASRYEYVPARKPRSRKPNYAAKGPWKLRPRGQWIAIPVPAVVAQDIWGRAQLQLARNVGLSFRNKEVRYLLRWLLTCGACRFAMSGMTWRMAMTGADGIERDGLTP